MPAMKNAKREAPVAGELERKSFRSQIKGIDTERRRIDFVISTESVDRYGDVIRVKGWDLKPYKSNPVVLFGHNSRDLPVGQAIKTWKEDGALRSTAQFATKEENPFADNVFRMYQGRFLRATSVGFMPREWDFLQDEEGNITGYDFKKSELLEFSCVPVPANPEALMDMRAKGIDTKPIKEWTEWALDEWGDREQEFRSLYGVDKKGLERIRKAAAGTGMVYRLTPEEQAALRERNFGGDIVINIGAGASEQRGAGKPLAFAESLGNEDEVEQKDTNMKVKHGIITVEASEVDELKAACKEAELYALPLPSKDGKKTFLLVPQIDDGMLQGVKSVELSREEVNGKSAVVIERAPKAALIAPKVLLENKDSLFGLEEKDGKVLLTIKGGNYHAQYRVHGMVDEDAELMMELVGTKDQKQQVKTAGKGTVNADDLDDEKKDTKKAAKGGDKDPPAGGADEADGGNEDDKDDKGGEKSGEGDELTNDVMKALTKLLAKSTKKQDEKPKEVDLGKSADEIEAALGRLEEALDAASKSKQFISKGVKRKLAFLGSYLRDLADTLDPDGKRKATTSKSEEKDEEIDEDSLHEFLSKAIEPRIAEIVAKEVRQARGQLD